MVKKNTDALRSNPLQYYKSVIGTPFVLPTLNTNDRGGHMKRQNIILGLVVVALMASCGKKNNSTSSGNGTQSTTNQVQPGWDPSTAQSVDIAVVQAKMAANIAKQDITVGNSFLKSTRTQNGAFLSINFLGIPLLNWNSGNGDKVGTITMSSPNEYVWEYKSGRTIYTHHDAKQDIYKKIFDLPGTAVEFRARTACLYVTDGAGAQSRVEAYVIDSVKYSVLGYNTGTPAVTVLKSVVVAPSLPLVYNPIAISEVFSWSSSNTVIRRYSLGDGEARRTYSVQSIGLCQ
jgi:uncharacterized protein YceK